MGREQRAPESTSTKSGADLLREIQEILRQHDRGLERIKPTYGQWVVEGHDCLWS